MKNLLALILLAPSAALAQSYTYPSFQQPTLVEREYNFAAADAGRAGTTLLFQWREGVAPRWQVGVDAGLADPDGNTSTRLVLGGHVAREITRATTDFPFDVLLTGGVGMSSAEGHRVIRAPIGASVGHSFALEGGMTLIPFVHPRLLLDRCNDCKVDKGARSAETQLNVAVDIGLALQMTSQVALRVAAIAGGSDFLGSGNGMGLSVAWTPKGLRK